MNKYESAVPAHMRGLWSAICAAEADAERDALLRQWDEACRLFAWVIWIIGCGAVAYAAVAMWLLHRGY